MIWYLVQKYIFSQAALLLCHDKTPDQFMWIAANDIFLIFYWGNTSAKVCGSSAERECWKKFPRVTVSCTTTGLPLPIITWMKNSLVVQSNPRTQVNGTRKKKSQYLLLIAAVEKGDYGEYQRVTNTSVGKITSAEAFISPKYRGKTRTENICSSSFHINALHTALKRSRLHLNFSLLQPSSVADL